jgi:hypothetical protein
MAVVQSTVATAAAAVALAAVAAVAINNRVSVVAVAEDKTL